jgi:hypothetical protein
MKRFVLIAIVVLTTSANAIAQLPSLRFELGNRIGVSRGILTTTEDILNFFEGPIQTGFTGGFFGRVTLFGVYIQPEVMFAQRPGKFEDIITPAKNFKTNLNYTDLNIIVGYRFLSVLRASVGTSYSMLLSQSIVPTNENGADVPKGDFNPSVFFLQYGAGIDLGKFCIDLRRDINLSQMGKIVEDVNGLATDFKTNSRQWVFTLGYKFLDIK